MEEKTIPYIAHEAALMRAEKTIKRLTIISILAIVLMFVSNFAWMYEWTQFDTRSYSYEQDGEGVNNVNLGSQGDVLNGTESPNQSETETGK